MPSKALSVISRNENRHVSTHSLLGANTATKENLTHYCSDHGPDKEKNPDENNMTNGRRKVDHPGLIHMEA